MASNCILDCCKSTFPVSILAIEVRLLYPAIRDSLNDAAKKEMIVYCKNKELEKISFVTDGEEAQKLADAVNNNSAYFTAVKEEGVNGKVALVLQKEAAGGLNPTITNEDYSDAFTALEPYKFNTICLDSNTPSVHSLLHSFIKRIYEEGALPIGVVGEAVTVPFADRISHAAAFNDEKMVYVGGAYKNTEGAVIDGCKAAAYIAGLISAVPSNQSIVHASIPGAVETAEKLTANQHITAIRSGMLTFSDTAGKGVWIDSGVNTLINPSAEQDEGWKKIKRVKVHFELFDRIDRTVEPIIGKINCDLDGVANIVKLGKDVIDKMAAEAKILPGGTMYEDPENPHQGDSAWFIIAVDDIDSLEKIYLNYQLRFSAN